MSFSQAALGASIVVPTLDENETVEIPAGTQSGSQQRVKRKGVPRLNGRGRGDLVVHVRVETPRRVSRRARELLHELAAEEAADPGLLDKVKEFLT